jgi:hypothetical protein
LQSVNQQNAVRMEEFVMKAPNFALKLATLASSVLLVGGLVAYQAGAFDRLIESSTQAPVKEISSNDPGRSQTSASEVDTTAPAEKIFLPGSKSISIAPQRSPVSSEAKEVEVPPQSAPDEEKSDVKPKRSFLPGSKAPSRGL